MNSEVKKSTLSRIVFWASVFVLLYITTGSLFNVYKYKLTGAVFELLWLPAIALIIVCPVISLVFWIKEKAGITSLYFYALILSAISFTILVQHD